MSWACCWRHLRTACLNEVLSVTMSFTSLSNRCAAFCTFGSESALSLHRASKVSLKKGTTPPRATYRESELGVSSC